MWEIYARNYASTPESTPVNKPPKPTPDFPLFPHACGQWAKKIKGKLHYFGPWSDPEAALVRYCGRASNPKRIASRVRSAKPYPDSPFYRHKSGQLAKRTRARVHYFGTDPDAALEKWLKQKDDLLAGRAPEDGDGLTVGRLANQFLISKQRLVDSGELNQRTWDDYHTICARVVPALGPGRLVANLVTVHGAAGRGTGPCFRRRVERLANVKRPKNGPVPSRPVNGYPISALPISRDSGPTSLKGPRAGNAPQRCYQSEGAVQLRLQATAICH